MGVILFIFWITAFIVYLIIDRDIVLITASAIVLIVCTAYELDITLLLQRCHKCGRRLTARETRRERISSGGCLRFPRDQVYYKCSNCGASRGTRVKSDLSGIFSSDSDF
jgi:DNA-directed RNA polymerase subunit RPC12/RpoP